jgi:signal peptidase I
VRPGICRTPVLWLLATLALAVTARQWVGVPIFVMGESMEPTLHHGQLAWVNRLAYRSSPPQRGEIVVVRTPKQWIVKRIVGLPGEQVAMRDGACYINGRRLAEPYVRFGGFDITAPGRLGPDRFLIAGDQRGQSAIAVVSRHRIVGRVVCSQNN